ncbi:hypothetical protein [Pedobacter faecalis]|uniref:hypothetical protein n=1 Tax=Pedobacter faecalis TaxID=3041495 RepID=UPI00254DA307|nr:hypothetical protein [Pedobacter sp. ELA7]
MSEQTTPQLRLRVFAGPNGSGKSTVIKSIRETEVDDNIKLDVGVYINADDIAKDLSAGDFSFQSYSVECTATDLVKFGETSGLLSNEFPADQFRNSIKISGPKLSLIIPESLDRVAQIIARFLRHAFIKARRRFSFETVFSHESNLDDMRLAAKAGYKVYLYFVGTESPEINKFRVALRVKGGGHHVPADRIEKRYVRSMELLKEAAEIAYQGYFFDNSINDEPYRLVGHFKVIAGKKEWDAIPEDQVSIWFRKYYSKT